MKSSRGGAVSKLPPAGPRTGPRGVNQVHEGGGRIHEEGSGKTKFSQSLEFLADLQDTAKYRLNSETAEIADLVGDVVPRFARSKHQFMYSYAIIVHIGSYKSK